jgi:hypothetical protein
MWRRIGALLGAVSITAAIYGVAYLRHQDSENWKRLEAQALRFEPPSGWIYVGRVKAGSYACWMSCDSPTITIVYRTTATVRSGCDQALVAVAAQVGRAKADPLATGCGWQAHAPPGGGPAFVTGGAQSPSGLGGPNAPPWTHKIPPTGNGTLVWVQFAAGSD